MDFITKGQEKQLNKIATIYGDGASKEKGFFPRDKKFNNKDKVKLIKNINIIAPTLSSVLKTPKIIKSHNCNEKYKKIILEDDFKELDFTIKEVLGMNSWGICEFKSYDVFKGKGIPYKNVIVMSKNMDKDKFNLKDLPNMDCQLEVMKIYGHTGIASLKVVEFLREKNYGAVPNHSLGGNIDYTKAGYKANLGFIGKNGLLITDKNGACNRLSVVYTSIENLSDFIKNEEDFSWGSEFCAKCNKCVKTCPFNAIYEKNIIDEEGHVECISNEKCNSGFVHYGCGKCIGCCPFTSVGYEKLKAIHKKINSTRG